MYFRFSNFQQRESALWKWFAHFKAKGIACCIVCHNPDSYSLYREGEEWTVYGVQRSLEHLNGDIVKIYDPNRVFSEQP